MSSTYLSLYYHLVFSTRNREALISREFNLRRVGTPGGFLAISLAFRGCRSCVAHSLPTRRSSDLMAVGEHDEMIFSGIRHHEPGGFGAISRWLRSNATIPPDQRPEPVCIPEGCQP